MELTERELLVQQLNFDWNSSNKNCKMFPHCFHVNSQETYQVLQYVKKMFRFKEKNLKTSKFLKFLL